MDLTIAIICDIIGLILIYLIITNPIKKELNGIKEVLEKFLNEQKTEKRKQKLERLEKLGNQNQNKNE